MGVIMSNVSSDYSVKLARTIFTECEAEQNFAFVTSGDNHLKLKVILGQCTQREEKRQNTVLQVQCCTAVIGGGVKGVMRQCEIVLKLYNT